jgi:hypothetical protein
MSDPSNRRLCFRAPWVIFWAGFAVRLACIFIGHTYRIHTIDDHWDFGYEAGRIARSVIEGHGYSSPFNGPSGPSAWLPPLFPLLLVLAFKLFGVYTKGAAIFVMACNSAFSAAIAPAVYEIAARCFDAYGLGRRSSTKAAPVALWSAWLWALYPAAIQFAIHWLWDMSLTTMLFTWAFVLALRLRRVGEAEEIASKPGHDLWLWAGFGLLWGLVGLSNASLLICLPVWILWVLWPLRGRKQQTGNSKQETGHGYRSLRQSVGGAVLACVVFVLTMMPWIVRNERVFHAFVPTRSNLGVELYQSMLPENEALPWGTSLPKWPGDPEFQRFVRMGEVSYGREKNAEARALIHACPEVFLHRTLDRFLFFWDGTPHPPGRRPIEEYLRLLNYSALSACGLLGLLLALKRHIQGAWLIALTFLLVPIPYYLVVVRARFRHPLEPFIALLAVYLFRSAQSRTERQQKVAE